MRHVFRNALIPITTVAALNFGALLGGAIVTETVFSLDGIGLLLHPEAPDPRPLRGDGLPRWSRRSHHRLQPDRRHRCTASSTRASAMTETEACPGAAGPERRLALPERPGARRREHRSGLGGGRRRRHPRGRPRAQGPQPVVVRAHALLPPPARAGRGCSAWWSSSAPESSPDFDRAVHATRRSTSTTSSRVRRRAPLLRHGRAGPRLVHPRHLGHPYLDGGRRLRRRRLDVRRPDHRSGRRLLRRLAGQPPHAGDRPRADAARCSRSCSRRRLCSGRATSGASRSSSSSSSGRGSPASSEASSSPCGRRSTSRRRRPPGQATRG